MISLGGSSLSKEFFDLAKSIGDSRSKQEEDRIICNEIVLLKSRFANPNATVKQIKEYLIRAIYIEMLGHDASFAYIHAVKLAHEKNILCKRTGYLSCNLFLNKDHELMLLLINTIQKDLKSDNHLEVWAALNCVCKLLNNEMIPAIFPIIKNLLNHKNELIRKKVCMLLHKIYLIDPTLIKEIDIYLKKLLCDVDPSVMGASLNLIFAIANNDMIYCMELVPYLVSILKQICENKLPKDYDYHRIPAPWIQIKILSIFRILGFSNKKLSEQMYEVLQKTMQRADYGINVGYAIIYECVKTITTIYPSHRLLELASLSISRFISSENHNLKYVGVTGLALIVKINPMYATKHQLAVVDCLEDKDETLKMKTLDLLYEMTNPLNVQVIVDKLIFHVENSQDMHFKHDLACKIIQLIERYPPNDIWFLNKINTLFLSVGELIDEAYSYSLIKLLKDCSIDGDSDVSDDYSPMDENSQSNNVNKEEEHLNSSELQSGEDLLKDSEDAGNDENGENNKNNVSEKLNNEEDNEADLPNNTNSSKNNKHEKKKSNDDTLNLRKYAVNTYIKMLEENENIPFVLIQIICFVLGEYSYLCDLENYTAEDILDLLCECMEKNLTNPDRVKSCIITAIFKLCCHNNITDHVVTNKIIEKYKSSQITDIQQKCYEYDSILKNRELIKNVFSKNNKTQNIVIDENLSFLNPFIEKHLESGGKSYVARDLRQCENTIETSKSASLTLNFTPYELPINNNINADIYNPSSPNLLYQKNRELSSFSNSQINDDCSSQMEKGKKMFKLNVVGPKKWKKETSKVEEVEANENKNNNTKKKKKKKKGKKNVSTYPGTNNGIINYLGEDRNKLSIEQMNKKQFNKLDNMNQSYTGRESYFKNPYYEEKKIKETNEEREDYNEDSEDDDDEDEDEEDSDDDSYTSENNEHEKRMDFAHDYDTNYENLYGNNIEGIKNNKYGNSNFNKKGANKDEQSKFRNNGMGDTTNELSEKEKMAAALFNGLISNNTSVFDSKNIYSQNFPNKKSLSMSNSNRNDLRHNKDSSSKINVKNNTYEESKNTINHPNPYDNRMANKNEEHDPSASIITRSNLNNSNKLGETSKKRYSYDMIDLNETPENRSVTLENNENKEKDKGMWNDITNQKKAVFLNKSKLSIFQTIKKFETNLDSNVVDVSKTEALVSCMYNNHKILIKIKIEDNKLIFLIKSHEKNIIDPVVDILRNLFHL
ncbi:AP-4 complex subunit epsilon, putative [Plasmodium chabaudi chabaudi]|uniref:AP-4 complex subunit epsilon, putative n=1 Tax=Plasmodium chabaudi chabaudi TaxID=31271 RepID=A0A1C6X6V7_PLACU|nr:AP-4 complex subunit epsilon, putative [Plasmodium chabaudi chabaudi]